MERLRFVVIPLLIVVLASSATLLSLGSTGHAQDDAEASLLTDPMLQLPTEDSVRVVWYTEFEGEGHALTYGEELDQTAPATTTKMTRMLEDGQSQIRDESYDEVVERDVWRHEAVATGLTQNVRVPYFVTSVDDDEETIVSDEFTLQPLPTPGHGMQILLTSDQQNRQMSPANFQKVMETVGSVDAVFFAGDLVDNPHRASEWFDRYDPEWMTSDPNPERPAFPDARPAFFPALQGSYQEIFPEFPYTGGEILQHAPLFGTIGNHESPGRWRPNETFILNGQEVTATINFMDNDPQPHWYAELRYEQQKETINPTDDPDIKEQWIRDNSFEHTQYFEMWNHPDDGPQGESYYAYQIGDVFVISMNVSRVWRTWNITDNSRGKFTEFTSELSNPDSWGFGDMWFENYNEGSEQYEWLTGVLESEEFQNAKYKVMLTHQTMFGLGDNAVPVMADRVMTIVYEQGGQEQTLEKTLPLDQATWEAEIEPILDSITAIRYEYPLDQDVWRNDIEPLLLQNNVDMVHVGHSHLWNRAQVGDLHYIETSNVGNSFGAYYSDDEGVYAERTRWASSFWDELASPDSRWNPENYASANDPHGRAPAFPTIFNPMREMLGAERDLPFLSSNAVTAFTIFDTATGTVSSYAFDARDPESEVRKFDEFSLIEAENPFRVEPYLQNPSADGMTVNWFSEENITGTLTLSGGDLAAPQEVTSTPELQAELTYSELELSEISDFPDMYENSNYKHSIRLSGLTPGTTYDYTVTLGDTSISASLTTAPAADTSEPIRFAVYADSETDPVGRTNKRDWGNSEDAPAAQAPESTGRPADLPKDSRERDLYLATEQEGYANNIAIIKEREPDFLMMAGDLVQGGGYQRAWDEFFRHNAGEFDNPLSMFPLLPALGNWENFGARNGGYEPAAVEAARQKYKAYFDAPENNNPNYQDQYYRVDYGPITIITLDSSNGLPDGTRDGDLPPSDADTQENVSEATYPGDDLADFNPGSDQWNWAEAQLQDAQAQGQIIFVQFHHVPYSSGVHGFPMSSPESSGQGGTPMRVYSPLFEEYGVVAVFSGHSEFFERSLVNGIHYYDVGVAGDGLRGPVAPEVAAESNPFSQWTSHYDAPELWNGNRLISGGKHYGHLEVNVVPNGDGSFEVTMTPVHAFPVIDDAFAITEWERREYNDEVQIRVNPGAGPAPGSGVIHFPLVVR